ncbi:MAG TPA: hypothetical protein VFE90_13370 [Myxococcales bacterium]|jgi:hypothetical protein|nr:hypothetical protein [Myxococcales bacterium]
MEPIALVVAAALAIVLLLRRPGVFSPVLVAEGMDRMGPSVPGDEDEQLPETDRAPRQWLPWAVGAVAALRVVMLVTLHA